MSESNNVIQNTVLPVVIIRGIAILPGTVIHFDLRKDKAVAAIEHAMMMGGQLLLLAQKESDRAEGDGPLSEVGTIVRVKQVVKLPGKVIRVLVEGIGRAEVVNVYRDREPAIEAEIVEITSLRERDLGESKEAANTVESAMLEQLREYYADYVKYHPRHSQNAIKRYENVKDIGQLIDQIAMNIPIDYNLKQQVLETISVLERYQVLCKILQNEADIAKMKAELSQKIRGQVDKNQKEYLLKEQLHYIREELGEEGASEADRFEAEVETLQASDEVKEKIKKEISRFRNASSGSSESAVERAYIETLLELPWDKASVDNESMKRAREILEREHYGLAKVKERILEFLAVRCLTKKGDSPILCLMGPPGTGKTSIAKSVAESLDKEYVRICLGGVRDEAEIRGHRKTYVGAMPGRIVTGLRQAGVKNPLMLLDEIDKVSNDYKGDTFSALLEVLDGEQNVRFRDHYVEIPIDLSEVLFIATANTTQTIPRPLLDRMEVIEVSSYTENEKFHIGKEHLLPKQLEKNGLTKSMLSIRDSALKSTISYYTREAGVRNLERRISEICRKAARRILEQREEGCTDIQKITVTAANLEEYLGKRKYSVNKANRKPQVGIVRGLAWTSVGGDTLQIEVNQMPGKGAIELTGQMGDVMKESAMIAMSYVRSIGRENHVKDEVFKENDFHIHIPEGAVPKDGPSAGVTMATAIFSAVTGKAVRSDLAMTGEVTLRGRVLPIGGLKEKILAAKQAGISEVLVPCENQKDIEEISEEIKEGLVITYVKSMKEVLDSALWEVKKGGN